MFKNVSFALVAAALLAGCSYGHQTLAISDNQRAVMEEDSRRIQNQERAERAERRAERREEMMDEAEAINRAYKDRKVYILH